MIIYLNLSIEMEESLANGVGPKKQKLFFKYFFKNLNIDRITFNDQAPEYFKKKI